MSVEPFPHQFVHGDRTEPPWLPKGTSWPAPRPTGPDRVPEPRGLLRRWVRRWRHRRAIAHLVMTQPDSVLHDVGLTRGDAMREAERPFWLA